MSTNLITARGAPLAVAILVAATAVAACGSSSSGSASASATANAAGSAQRANRSALTTCLREHGVRLPSRGAGPGGGAPPSGSAGPGVPPSGFSGGPPAGFSGGPGGNSKIRAAFRACGAAAPTGRRASGSFRAAIVKYVTCVRRHGYQLPNPNLTGQGAVFSAKIQSDPKFKTPSKACQNLLAGRRPDESGAR